MVPSEGAGESEGPGRQTSIYTDRRLSPRPGFYTGRNIGPQGHQPQQRHQHQQRSSEGDSSLRDNKKKTIVQESEKGWTMGRFALDILPAFNRETERWTCSARDNNEGEERRHF